MKGNLLSSANPRKFSRAPEHLDPTEKLSVFVALTVSRGRQELRDTVARIEYAASKHPQIVVTPAAVSEDGPEFIAVTLEVHVGEAGAALKGDSVRLRSALVFLQTLMRDCFDLRPHFTGPPTLAERELLSVALMSA